ARWDVIFRLSMLEAGVVFSGGLIGALIAAVWYIRRQHMPPLATCDAFAPGLAIGHAIGRLGCFAAGCCFGKPTHAWWGVTFTNPVAHDLVGTPLNEALEPTQLFESAVELANFFLLMWMLKRKKFDGQVFGAYLILYGVARFFLELLRGDPGRGSVFGGAMGGARWVGFRGSDERDAVDCDWTRGCGWSDLVAEEWGAQGAGGEGVVRKQPSAL